MDRVFTMAWVVWGHSYIMQAQVAQNIMHAKEVGRDRLRGLLRNLLLTTLTTIRVLFLYVFCKVKAL